MAQWEKAPIQPDDVLSLIPRTHRAKERADSTPPSDIPMPAGREHAAT